MYYAYIHVEGKKGLARAYLADAESIQAARKHGIIAIRISQSKGAKYIDYFRDDKIRSGRLIKLPDNVFPDYFWQSTADRHYRYVNENGSLGAYLPKYIVEKLMRATAKNSDILNKHLELLDKRYK